MDDKSSWNDLHRHFFALPSDCPPGFDVAIVYGEVENNAVWTFEPSRHHVFVHLQGELRPFHARLENGPWSSSALKSGDIWIVPAGFRFRAEVGGTTTRFCEIRLPVTGPDCDHIELNPLLGARDDLLYEAAKNFERKMAETPEDSPTSTRMLAAALYWHIIDRYQLNEEQDHASDQKLSFCTKDALVDFINDNLSQRITIEELAGVSGQNVHMLLRQFYASFGTTPAQYIVRVRVERAKSLLSLSRFAIDEIATRCGFHSASHFCTSFIKHVGIAPLSYRQAHR